jgi:hypothetical protein
MINDPDILADIARYHRAEMIAAADEFRRAKQSRRLRRPSRKLLRPVTRAEGVPDQSGPGQRPHQAELEGHGGREASKFAYVQMPQVDGLGSVQIPGTVGGRPARIRLRVRRSVCARTACAPPLRRRPSLPNRRLGIVKYSRY